MARHNANALAVARFLEGHDRVTRVYHPGLPGSPDGARAGGVLDGFGGMLSFEIEGDVEAAERMLGRLTIPVVASSLGGVESLITRPATTSHASLSPEERTRLGITDGLVRMSVGIEDADDLIADLANALA